MKVAWFLARPSATPHPIDDTPSLLAELGSRHQIDLYDEQRAHDFVWRQWRSPYDVCVYELTDRADAAFVWPYLLRYPGIVRLRSSSLGRTRAQMLHRMRRAGDYAAEVAVAGRDALRIPLAASRLVVVGDEYIAHALQAEYPEARVRHAPLSVPDCGPPMRPAHATPIFGVAGESSRGLIMGGAERARAAGTPIELRLDVVTTEGLRECDVVLSLPWPSVPEPPIAALFAMACGRPAVVYESAATAHWPALNPQTWQPRAFYDGADPVVVSIDPRDTEHSLMLTMRRLAVDHGLRTTLSEAALVWRHAHTPTTAAAAWDALLAEAAEIQPRPLPAGWPAHLTADGTERARAILSEFGVRVDFLG